MMRFRLGDKLGAEEIELNSGIVEKVQLNNWRSKVRGEVGP